MIASVIWLMLALPPISYVVVPAAIVCPVARMIRSAAPSSPRYWSIHAPARIVAHGFTLFIPLYFGAEPCAGSNIA